MSAIGRNDASTCLEECDLVLIASIWRIRCGCHQREVVVQEAFAEVLRCLGDDLGALHCLAIPERCAVLSNVVTDSSFRGSFNRLQW